jgi:cytochrome c oxidase subunit 2
VRRLSFVLVGLVLVGAIVAPTALAQFAPVSPESPNAEKIRNGYLFVTFFALLVFVAVEALLVIFIFRYRRRRRPRFEDGPEIHGATNLELAWTAVPVVILFLIAAFIFIELPGIKDIPAATAGERQLDVTVTGRQFYWQFEYPNGAIAIDQLRAPVGVPVRLDVTAPDTDVIHSWWIPALGGKIDAIPGRVNQTWFKASKPGTYSGQCAELCGLEHARMLASVEVMTRDAFDAWLAQRRQEQTAGSTDLGQEEWQGVCSKCHGLGGQGGIGPSIVGSPTLTDAAALGTLVRNGARTMPAVGAGWSDEQVTALAKYLKETPPSGS